MKNNRIAIIIPYFGRWPEWIELYFHSCERNNFIDWYFFTDCAIPTNYGSNLHFVNTTFDAYCHNVSAVLGINFTPNSPYKLCGLKPFYGYIHKEILSTYEFWGFGDIDTIWGDLKSFYIQDMLMKYDVFSTHADRLSGHLAIIRNTPAYTELGFKITNWQAKLESQEALALDEQDFSWLLYPNARLISKLYSKIIRKIFNWRDAWVIYYHLMPLVNKISWIIPQKLYFKEQHTTPILGGDGRTFEHDSEDWIYNDGKIINPKNGKEYIYLHFMIYKKNSFRNDYFWKENYYHIAKGYDFSKGVKINTEGFFPI